MQRYSFSRLDGIEVHWVALARADAQSQTCRNNSLESDKLWGIGGHTDRCACRGTWGTTAGTAMAGSWWGPLRQELSTLPCTVWSRVALGGQLHRTSCTRTSRAEEMCGKQWPELGCRLKLPGALGHTAAVWVESWRKYVVKTMTWRHLALETIMQAEQEGEHLPFQCYPLFSTQLP